MRHDLSFAGWVTSRSAKGFVLASLAIACTNGPDYQRGVERSGGAGPADSGSGGAVEGGAGAGGASEDAGRSGGSPGAGGDPLADGEAPAGDPCAGVPAKGICESDSVVRYCAIPTGDGVPKVVSRICRYFEECREGALGARCAPKVGSCVPGGTECVDSTTIRSCGDDARWAVEKCGTACKTSALGAFCSASIVTKSYTNEFFYERFAPDADFSDWQAEPEDRPAAGVLVASFRGSGVLVDASVVGADGSFTLQVPATPNDEDGVFFYLVHPDETGATADFAVFQPEVGAGEVDIDLDGVLANVWSFAALPLTDFPAGTAIHATEAMGSGAIHVFEHLREANEFATATYGEPARSVVAWMNRDTAWTCGACFLALPTETAGIQFASQLFFSWTARDRSYWSDPVTVHEVGHHTMFSYGRSPEEGGPHCVGIPTLPGMAWSEGWATAFSSIQRGSPRYYDKQSGSMFWLDLGLRRYDDQTPWRRADPGEGLLQFMDENEISAMIWELSQDPEIGEARVLEALRHPSVTQPPFGRGYTRHSWETDDECMPSRLQVSRESAPTFADYLDALRCLDAPAAAVDAVTEPADHYPYPSDQPICR